MKKIIKIILVSVLLLSSLGCQEDKKELEYEGNEQQTDLEYIPKEEEIKHLTKRWVWVGQTAEGKIYYNLDLLEDDLAEMVVQDDIGQLLNLYGGNWKIIDENIIHLDLHLDSPDETIGENDQKELSGNYKVSFENNYGLNVVCLNDASPLVKDHESHSIVFREEKMYKNAMGFAYTDLGKAAISYYSEIYGELSNYEIDYEENENGVLLHIYEDLDDHVATIAWYLVDDETGLGSDEITGEEIDLTPYLMQGCD